MNTTKDRHSTDSITARAKEVLAFIAGERMHRDLAEVLTMTREQFVDGESEPRLRHLAELLVQARTQSNIQNQLDEDREQLHHGHLRRDELISVGHHYEMLRREACAYNHHLRGFIEANREYITREDLASWLGGASQGRHKWVEGEITGAVSEVALHVALMGLPELGGLRYATLDEDLKGYDFVSSWQGQLVTIDAKTGSYPPLSERKHGHRHLEVSVPRPAMDGFRLTRHGLDRLRREVRQVLGGHTGTANHGPHRIYRTA